MKWTIRKRILAAFSVVWIVLIVQLALNWQMIKGSIAATEEARDVGYAGAALATEVELDLNGTWQWLTDIRAMPEMWFPVQLLLTMRNPVTFAQFLVMVMPLCTPLGSMVVVAEPLPTRVTVLLRMTCST